MTAQFWRKWHRWIGFPSAVFLVFVAITGILIAIVEFFGEAERIREATRDLVSPETTRSPMSTWSPPVARALAAVDARRGEAHIDKVEVQFKGDPPTVTVYTGKPTGGEDRKYVVNLETGAVLSDEDYADKPLLNRLHSLEAFGDGGLVVAMLCGLALALLGFSGLVIYIRVLRLPHRHAAGIRRIFW